eukprot:gene29445-35307_t
MPPARRALLTAAALRAAPARAGQICATPGTGYCRVAGGKYP